MPLDLEQLESQIEAGVADVVARATRRPKLFPPGGVMEYPVGDGDSLYPETQKGGPGSGNFGHTGRPGQIGGSGPGDSGPGGSGGPTAVSADIGNYDEGLGRQIASQIARGTGDFELLDAKLKERLGTIFVDDHGTQPVSLVRHAYVEAAVVDAPDFIQQVLKSREYQVEVIGGSGGNVVVDGQVVGRRGGMTNHRSGEVQIFTEGNSPHGMYDVATHELGHVGYDYLVTRAAVDPEIATAIKDYQAAVLKEGGITDYVNAFLKKQGVPAMIMNRAGVLTPVFAHEAFADQMKYRNSPAYRYQGSKWRESWEAFERLIDLGNLRAVQQAEAAGLTSRRMEDVIDIPMGDGRISRYIMENGVLVAHVTIVPVSTQKGGPGSGNFGHAGRPGEIGGSASNGGGSESGQNALLSAGATAAATPAGGKAPQTAHERAIQQRAKAAVILVPGADKYGKPILEDSVSRLPLPIQDLVGRYAHIIPGGDVESIERIEQKAPGSLPVDVGGVTPNNQRTIIIAEVTYTHPEIIAHELGHVILNTIADAHPDLLDAFDQATAENPPLSDYAASNPINIMQPVGKTRMSIAAHENFGEAMRIITEIAMKGQEWDRVVEQSAPPNIDWNDPKHLVAAIRSLEPNRPVWEAAANIVEAALKYTPSPTPPLKVPLPNVTMTPRKNPVHVARAETRTIDLVYSDGRISRYVIEADGSLTHITIESTPAQKGSATSGNYGHAGRPGLVGGSAPAEGGGATPPREILASPLAASIVAVADADPDPVAGRRKLLATVSGMHTPFKDLIRKYALLIPGGSAGTMASMTHEDFPEGTAAVTIPNGPLILVSREAYSMPDVLAHELGHVMLNRIGEIRPDLLEKLQLATEKDSPATSYSAGASINVLYGVGKGTISAAANENFGEIMRHLYNYDDPYVTGSTSGMKMMLENPPEHLKPYLEHIGPVVSEILDVLQNDKPPTPTLPPRPWTWSSQAVGVKPPVYRKAQGELQHIDFEYPDGRISRHIVRDGRFVAHIMILPEPAQKAAPLSDQPNSDVAADLPGVSGSSRYRIITVGDDRVCPVCEYMESVGSFRLKDALAQYDNFMDAVDDGDLETALSDSSPFVSIDDIDGLGVKSLTNLGVSVPPFHPNCRCGIAIV